VGGRQVDFLVEENSMNYKILASDYDNTLVVFGEKGPRPAVEEAILKMQAAGGKFVLSTGRAYCAVSQPGRLGRIRFDYAITCNGACVMDADGRCLAEHPLTNEEMYALVDYCEDYNFPLEFAFRDGYYAYENYEYFREMYAQMPDSGLSAIDGEDQDRHLIDMPHAAFALLTDEGIKGFEEKYGYLGLHIMRVGQEHPGGLNCYDIVRGGLDKGVGLADLCKVMQIDLSQVVATGDSANDCGMLKAAGLGACVSNGTPDAKAAADREIGDVREDAVAALIEELWFDGPKAEPSGSELGSAWGKL
jgi:hypothetical protein